MESEPSPNESENLEKTTSFDVTKEVRAEFGTVKDHLGCCLLHQLGFTHAKLRGETNSTLGHSDDFCSCFGKPVWLIKSSGGRIFSPGLRKTYGRNFSTISLQAWSDRVG